MKTNATTAQMEQALKQVNNLYDGNICFNNFTQKGKQIIFTLRVKDSKGKGAGRSYSGRRLTSACWHTHGNFFDCLFDIDKNIKVFSSRAGWIDRRGGNWQDFNVGSQCQPTMASECCEC